MAAYARSPDGGRTACDSQTNPETAAPRRSDWMELSTADAASWRQTQGCTLWTLSVVCQAPWDLPAEGKTGHRHEMWEMQTVHLVLIRKTAAFLLFYICLQAHSLAWTNMAATVESTSTTQLKRWVWKTFMLNVVFNEEVLYINNVFERWYKIKNILKATKVKLLVRMHFRIMHIIYYNNWCSVMFYFRKVEVC